MLILKEMDNSSLRNLFLLFIISFLLGILSAQNVSSEQQNHIERNTVINSTSISTKKPLDELLEKWETMDRITKRVINQGIKRLIPIVMDSYGTINVSIACTRNILKFIAALKENKVWAFSMIDATGKGLDGLLSGSLAALGDYDQCLNTEAINERRGSNYGKVLFRGKYCAVDIRPPLPPKKLFYKLDEVPEELRNFTKKGTITAEAAKSAHIFYMLAVRIGLCVPSGCSAEDISNILHGMSRDEILDIRVKRCEVKEPKVVTPVIMFVWTLYGIFVLLLILGTAVDVICYNRKQKIEGTCLNVLKSFSFVTNFQKLVNTSNSTGKLSCLSGIKTLSITWIILAHTYLNINYQIFRGFRLVTTYPKDFAFQAIINAAVAVDTFFFIGGLLVCYVTIKIVKEMGKPFSFVFYVVHRMWRLLPLYTAVILLVLSLRIVSSGPIWHDTVDKHFDDCYKNWWSNLIFLNNFLHPTSLCMTHSWYVSCDMQLYLFSLIILLPLLRWPKVGIVLAIVCTIVSMIVTSLVVYLNKFPPTMLFIHPDPEQRAVYWGATYFKPYSHAGPYFVGILVGYLLVTKPNIHFPRVVQVLGWCAAIICNLSVLYGVLGWNRGHDPTLWETIFYSGCHRTAWAIGVAWVVICCATGQGGVVHYILTWKAWIPLSRLTYAAYLIHPIVQMGIVGSLRMKLQPTQDFAVWMYFGHLMMTYLASFGLSMLIEAPCLALEKNLLQKKGAVKDARSKTTTGNAATFENDRIEKPIVDNEAHLQDSVQRNQVCRL